MYINKSRLYFNDATGPRTNEFEIAFDTIKMWLNCFYLSRVLCYFKDRLSIPWNRLCIPRKFLFRIIPQRLFRQTVVNSSKITLERFTRYLVVVPHKCARASIARRSRKTKQILLEGKLNTRGMSKTSHFYEMMLLKLSSLRLCLGPLGTKLCKFRIT